MQVRSRRGQTVFCRRSFLARAGQIIWRSRRRLSLFAADLGRSHRACRRRTLVSGTVGRLKKQGKEQSMISEVKSQQPSTASHAEADLALRRLAAVIADRQATVDQVMTALREWSRIVLDRRELASMSAPLQERQPHAAGIEDIVSLSREALQRQAS